MDEVVKNYFYKSGCLENTVIHDVDSTELPCEKTILPDSVVVRSTFTTIATLLIEMAGIRHKLQKKDKQKELFAATG